MGIQTVFISIRCFSVSAFACKSGAFFFGLAVSVFLVASVQGLRGGAGDWGG